jgi:DNA-binding transcriptional regulator YdaS (Cro superfamily)
MDTFTPKDRAELAALACINEQYLYQCLTGRRVMDAKEAVRVERVTSGRLRRWHLRHDWADTWPELVGSFDAPKPVESAAKA